MENAHVSQRGLFLFGMLGSPEPHETDKKKVPRFFMPLSQRKKSVSRLWDLGKSKKKYLIKLKVVPDTN